MESTSDVTCCEYFELFPGLKQETALPNLDRMPLSVSEPDTQAWIPGFAVDGEEVEIVMEACENGALLVFGQIAAGGSQKVRPLKKQVGKMSLLYAQAQSGHLADRPHTLQHAPAPTIHVLLELRKIRRNRSLWLELHVLSRPLTHCPEVSPFSITRNGLTSYWLVIFIQTIYHQIMNSSSFKSIRSHSRLKTQFRVAIL